LNFKNPPIFLILSLQNKRPPGLTKEEFKHLELEVFKSEGEQDDGSASIDCSICLDKYSDGNEVVVLHSI
jgi:hypothetical protein